MWPGLKIILLVKYCSNYKTRTEHLAAACSGCGQWTHCRRRTESIAKRETTLKETEGLATKEISYTLWRNQLKSSWNHEKSKQISLKSSSKSAQPSCPTHFHNVWRHFQGKSRGNQREIRKSRTPKLLVADPSKETASIGALYSFDTSNI